MAEQPAQSPGGSATSNGAHHVDVSLLDYLIVIWRFRWLILALTTLTTVLAVSISFILTKTYRAELVMAAVPQAPGDRSVLTELSSQLGGLANLVGIDQVPRGDMAKFLAILKSRSFSETFIQSNNLLPVLFPHAWDSVTQQWKVESEDIPSMWNAYKVFDEDVRRVTEDSITGLFRVSIELPDPELAALLANRLVADVNHFIRQNAVTEAQKSLEYLNDELAKAGAVELRQAIYRLIETQIQKIMLANVREDYAFTVIDPAAPPDLDDFIWPNHLVFGLAGLIFGLFIGTCAALTINLKPDSAGH